MDKFDLISEFEPKGDQPKAIEELVRGLKDGLTHQVLLGVTGSGKTFTMANVVAQVNRPTLVIAHNKTLAAQLFSEFKELFPHNAVEYFVSYYDYYQPEAYIPRTDTYIEKDASINDDIDKMRHSATRSVLSRRDVIVVASVSCIYGIGSPENYSGMVVALDEGIEVERDALLADLVAMQYERNDYDFHRGTFRVRGDVVEVFPPYETQSAIRIEFFGDIIETISEVDPLTGKRIRRLRHAVIYPGSHYVTPGEHMRDAVESIERELDERLDELRAAGKLLEAERLETRTRYDLEMMREIGFCPGIENYSRHLDGRSPGEPPYTLIDYFPRDFLLFVDESHQTIPQLNGMYRGDRSRKENLVQYGFRLPSALDNRPLTFEEFEQRVNQVTYVSATPAAYELKKSGGLVAEQVIRPTGLVDPAVEIRAAKNQVEDLLEEIRKRVEKGHRVLVTTLTKRMAEDLTDYYRDLGVRVRYLHSDIETLERVEIIRDLRKGDFDVLVGINLLREGLDIPEVSLVAILDADKEGFLRSQTSLIQTCGRAARHIDGAVIMYADVTTKSLEEALKETRRRRRMQLSYNKRHKITPETVKKSIHDVLSSIYEADYYTVPVVAEDKEEYIPPSEIPQLIKSLKNEMKRAAGELDFERAAELRDRISRLQQVELLGDRDMSWKPDKKRRARKQAAGTRYSRPRTKAR
jgi:excinuclease ABC subunit B